MLGAGIVSNSVSSLENGALGANVGNLFKCTYPTNKWFQLRKPETKNSSTGWSFFVLANPLD
jgi:hypothetical protein